MLKEKSVSQKTFIYLLINLFTNRYSPKHCVGLNANYECFCNESKCKNGKTFTKCSLKIFHFGNSAVLLKAAHINCRALDQSHITLKDNYLLVERRRELCVRGRAHVCVSVCLCARK